MFVWLCAYAIEYVGKYFDPNTNVDKKVQRTYQDKRKKEEKHVFGSTLKKNEN